MSGAYWKMVGENIAKGLSPKTIQRLSISGRFLSRTGAAVGVGFLVYELIKNYKGNIENEPAYKEMMILQGEMEKWTSAISCLGRDPLKEKEYGSFNDGGAINALYKKKAFRGPGFRAADPHEAFLLIGRSIDYILEAENILEDDKFEEKKSALVAQLRKLHERIHRVNDFRPIQKSIAHIVDQIRPIESAYSVRIYDCSREIQKTLGSNAAWAAVSTATLGFVKKPVA